ncbi:MAG: NINE protein, partial [Ktedonobacterales bacterium]
MSVDIAQLSAHLAPDQQGPVKRAYQRAAKHDTTAFLLCFFLGLFGAHRFYMNRMGSGLAHLGLTVVGIAALVGGFLTQQPLNIILFVAGLLLLLFGLIWEAIDLFAIDNQVHARNLALAERLISAAAFADPTVLHQAA